MLIAVNYHYVRPSFEGLRSGMVGMTTEAFAKQLETLRRAGTFVSPRDVLRAVRGERALPAKALLVTFDDGLREQCEHAWPILWKMGIPALLFVNTRPISEGLVCTVHKIHLLRCSLDADELWRLIELTAAGFGMKLPGGAGGENVRAQYPFDTPGAARLKYLLNFALSATDRELLVAACFRTCYGAAERQISRGLYMTPDQLHSLGGFDAIGSHGHDHLPLALIGPGAMDRSIGLSADLLQQWIVRRPLAISYPYGSLEAVTPDVAATAQRHSFQFGFTVEMAGNDNTRLAASPLLLARYDCNYMPGGKLARWSAEELFESVPVSQWYNTPPGEGKATGVSAANHV